MRSSRKWLLISLVISIIAIALVLFFTVTEETLMSLTKIKPLYLLIALGLRVLSWFVWGSRIKVLGKVIGSEISLVQATKIVVSGTFAAGVTPSYVGGEPARIYLLGREGMSYGDAAAVDLVGRVLDGLATGGAFIFAWILFRRSIGLNPTIASFFIIIAVVFFFVIGIGLYSIRDPERIRSLLGRFERSKLLERITFGRSSSLINRLAVEIDNFRNGLSMLIRGDIRSLSLSVFLTIIFWIFLYSIAPVVLIGLGSDPMWLSAMSVQALLMILAMIPLAPGGSGVVELSAASLYGSIFPPEDIQILGVFVLVWRFVSYHTNLIVGGFVTLYMLKETNLPGISDVLDNSAESEDG
ncbi:MAG: flippase-like domain-containing protein [Halobacteriota archaeon]|nr:flippase-like domain-containing protein [Halobacteriota archaeon]